MDGIELRVDLLVMYELTFVKKLYFVLEINNMETGNDNMFMTRLYRQFSKLDTS